MLRRLGLDLSEPLFVDLKRLNLGIERRLWNTEPGRSARRARHSAIAFRQGCLDQLLLLGSEPLRKWLCERIGGQCASAEPSLIDRKVLRITDDYGPFDHVLQLSDIARPSIKPKE